MDGRFVPFRKYEKIGAYHWAECERASFRYNPPLEARYQAVTRRIQGVRRLLDVGCGDGYLMSLLSPFCENVIGIDSDPAGVKIAAEKLQFFTNCAVTEGSGYELPFEKACFDLVVLADVIEHLEDPDLCLREICRVLKPKGRLLLTTPKWRPDRAWDSCHVREFKPEELRSVLNPFFSKISFKFFWPLVWSNRYATKVGWRLIRLLSRYFYNPFLREGDEPEKYGQILAISSDPR